MANSGEVLKSWVRAITFVGMTAFWLWMVSEGRNAELTIEFWSVYGVIGGSLMGERILKSIKGGLSSVKIVKGGNGK